MESNQINSKSPAYAILGTLIAVIFWLFDATVHYFFYGEPEFEWFPSDFNELWMRCTIVALLILMGGYAQVTTNKRLRIEHEKLELQKQKAEITQETVMHMHHIINNFLNNLSLFQFEAKNNKTISDESIVLFDRLVKEAAKEIRDLGEEALEKSTKP